MASSKKKNVQKFSNQYMALGICFGSLIGVMVGTSIVPALGISMGMSYGLLIGMLLGLALGAAKDKRLAEQNRTVSSITAMENAPDFTVCTVDAAGTQASFRVSAKQMKAEAFAIGDRVAEEPKDTLISLESK